MEPVILELISSSAGSALALGLFYLCNLNADKQRTAYQDQINDLYEMLGRMLSSVERSLDLLEGGGRKQSGD